VAVNREAHWTVRYRWLSALLLPLLATGCMSLAAPQRAQIEHLVAQARSSESTCTETNACARPSPLRALAQGDQVRTEGAPLTQHALLLDYGQDALLARLDLMRSAQRSIDLQTYIFDEDDAGHLILDELLTAARRGVKVRMLVDQLSALRRVETLAALSAIHANFELRIYNPLLGKAKINYPQYALAALCCWRRLNQRMHNKLLVIDGIIGMTGGRNYQNEYYDWNLEFNFRDRDVLITGPGVAAMAENFDAFWQARLSVPTEQLRDVGRHLLHRGIPPLPAEPFTHPQRVQAISRDADDAELVRERLLDAAVAVASIRFVADTPAKHRRNREHTTSPTSSGLLDLIQSAQREVLLQTPYLVLSKPARDVFETLQTRPVPPQVIISTNSLAATDAFITYALSYKYKRRYLRDYRFEIHEYKPFPEDAPVDLDATGAFAIVWEPDGSAVLDSHADVAGRDRPRRPPALSREYAALRYAGIGINRRVPLSRTGIRFGLHAKSLVIDERIGIIGTHNFDPRGDDYNTENAVIINDAVFARMLASSIRRDVRPENAWTIARRDRPPVLSGLKYSLEKVSEHLPVFDLWPTRYATSYEFVPSAECPVPLSPYAPGFRACHVPVGDFPDVALSFRRLLTRIFTAFGAGLAPIL